MQDGSADRSWDAAWGALLGAAGGDAAGAVLEFTPIRGDEHVHSAMRMPGGGAHGVGPGQLTDDTELALCLAHVSAGSAP